MRRTGCLFTIMLPNPGWKAWASLLQNTWSKASTVQDTSWDILSLYLSTVTQDSWLQQSMLQQRQPTPTIKIKSTTCLTPIQSHNINCHDLHLVVGVFNARLVQDNHKEAPKVLGPHLLHDTTNTNGNNFALQLTWYAQSRFPRPRFGQWTWTHPLGSCAQRDLISGKWTNSLEWHRARLQPTLGL